MCVCVGGGDSASKTGPNETYITNSYDPTDQYSCLNETGKFCPLTRKGLTAGVMPATAGALEAVELTVEGVEDLPG